MNPIAHWLKYAPANPANLATFIAAIQRDAIESAARVCDQRADDCSKDDDDDLATAMSSLARDVRALLPAAPPSAGETKHVG